MNFNIIIDDLFSVYSLDETLTPIGKKRLLSLVNGFEDGSWQFENFQKFIWNNIKETALSLKEREALIQEGEDSVLTQAAKNLRLAESLNDIGRGSEIAEIVLYGIMKSHYGALPVVPKIFYKQNRQDNAKGADSVHIVVNTDNTFSLWLGESKFYSSIENARLQPIIDSVKECLDLDKLKKENSIITNLSDLQDFTEIKPEVKAEIMSLLSQKESIDKIKPILHIPILLLHECDITKNETHYTTDYVEKIKEFHKDRATAYFKKQISECNTVDLYSEISFHIILFPVPDKEPIVDKFITKAKVYRD